MGPALIIFQVTAEKLHCVQKLTLKPIKTHFIFRFLRSTFKPNTAGRFSIDLACIDSDP